ncbi:hypothetical protein CARUB_v10024578mg, partial [Capsella rubella]
PSVGNIKCNVHVSWVNAATFCGGAWMLKNHDGNALFHSRDAFLPVVNRITVELQCIIWCLTSLHELRVELVLLTDCIA